MSTEEQKETGTSTETVAPAEAIPAPADSATVTGSDAASGGRTPGRANGGAPRSGQRSQRHEGSSPRRTGNAATEEGPQLVEKVVYVNRCAKVVKGGRRFSFSALVVVGDRNGKVGQGFGKANEVSDAIRKGTDAAKRAMKKVTVVNETLPHEVYSEFGGAKIVLKPAAPGTGLVAGEKVRAVLEAAGVSNVIAKSLGSSNAANVVKATMQAMLSMRTADQVLAARGKKKKEQASV